MRAGRNDPCPCGSGRKYKKCCLAQEEGAREKASASEASRGDAERLRQAAFDALTDFSLREEPDARARRTMRAFGVDAPPPGANEDDVEFKFWWYWHFDAPTSSGSTIASDFLASEAKTLPAAQRSLLERLSRARLRLYEIQDVRRDEGVQLRDLRSGVDVWVRERLGTRQLERWDILAARIVPEEDGAFEMHGGAYLFEPEQKRDLLAALRKEERKLERAGAPVDDDALFRRFVPVVHKRWLARFAPRPLPTLVTAEGDAMVFGKSTFDITDAPALRAALDRHPDLVGDDGDYIWLETPGSARALGHIRIEDARLTLDTTSRPRTDRGRALLEHAAGQAIRHRATRYESVASAMRSREGRPTSEDVAPPADAARVVAGFKDRHYRGWPDTPLPALDGRTPRHAARLKTVRPRLIDLLKEMQNHESRGATPDAPAYDFDWIWRELGLEGEDRP